MTKAAAMQVTLTATPNVPIYYTIDNTSALESGAFTADSAKTYNPATGVPISAGCATTHHAPPRVPSRLFGFAVAQLQAAALCPVHPASHWDCLAAAGCSWTMHSAARPRLFQHLLAASHQASLDTASRALPAGA